MLLQAVKLEVQAVAEVVATLHLEVLELQIKAGLEAKDIGLVAE
jgi:hypothetical protein